MKVKEIEFGVNISLRNRESTRLSMRVELQEGEDYLQTLTWLKEEVIKLSAADQVDKGWLLERIGRNDQDDELKKKGQEIREVEQLIQSKHEELEDLTYKLGQVEDQVIKASNLLKSIEQFEDCSLTEAQKLVKTYEKLKALQNSSEDSDNEGDPVPW